MNFEPETRGTLRLETRIYGTSVLGADNKAAVANIMTARTALVNSLLI